MQASSRHSSQQPQTRHNYQSTQEAISQTKATPAALRLLLVRRQVPPCPSKETSPTMARVAFCYDVLVGKKIGEVTGGGVYGQ